MSRARKTSRHLGQPSEVQEFFSSRSLDGATLSRWEIKVSDLWRAAANAPPTITADQMHYLTLEVISCVAQPESWDEEEITANEKARAAINTLLAWCHRDPNDNGLPHLVFRDARLITLEQALLKAQPLAAAKKRAWFYPAFALWTMVHRIMASANGTASISATSHTVRFISAALIWVGHASATDSAISAVLAEHKEYRERLIS